jgi:hypothetical protein
MANADTPFGLRPIRHRNGAPYNGAVNPYYVPAGYAVNLFIGDPVIKNGEANTTFVSSAGTGEFNVGTLPVIVLATLAATNRMTGIIVGFAPNPDNLTTQYGAASTERVALVCDDPDVIFQIQADGAVPAASIGLNAIIITGSGSTTSGLSGMELDTTATAPAGDATYTLLILRGVNKPNNDITITHGKLEVLINLHTENQGTVGTIGV